MELLNFADEEVQILRNGLNVLQAAIRALGQPIPNQISQLNEKIQGLTFTPTDLESKETLTTLEAAAYLGITKQQVNYLGAAKSIQIATKGKRGRGSTNTYNTSSILQYAQNRPLPGRKPTSKISV